MFNFDKIVDVISKNFGPCEIIMRRELGVENPVGIAWRKQVMRRSYIVRIEDRGEERSCVMYLHQVDKPYEVAATYSDLREFVFGSKPDPRLFHEAQNTWLSENSPTKVGGEA